MAQDCRMKLLEQEAQLFKSEAALERLKNQKLQALVKNGVARHFEARSKEKTRAVDLKLKKLAKLKGEVGAKDRVDGCEGKISALEMANLKLSARIEDLILETEREIYGTESTTLTPSIQDQRASNDSIVQEPKLSNKKPMSNSQLQLKSVTPRTKIPQEISHPRSKLDNLETTRKITSLLTHENKADSRHPATDTSPTFGGNRKLATKHPEVLSCSVNKKFSKTLHPANDNPLKRQDRKILQPPSTSFVSMKHQNFQNNLSDKLIKTAPIKAKQTSPCSPHSPITQSTSSGSRRGSVDNPYPGNQVRRSTPILDADKMKHENSQREISRPPPKQLTPRAIKINRMSCHEAKGSNLLSIDSTHLVGKKEPIEKGKDMRSQTLNLNSDMMGEGTSKHTPKIDDTPHLVGIGKESHREGDFRRQARVRHCTNKGEDQRQEDYLRQMLVSLTPRSAKTGSDSSRNSSASFSPKNDKSRPWYERLPIPDVDLFDDSPDINYGFSTDSDSSGKVPVKVCLQPRKDYDAWTYLGDQTALMPRPVIKTSCKFIGNLNRLNLSDGDTESN